MIEKVIIIGTGQIACFCLKEVLRYNVSVSVVESSYSPISFLAKVTQQNNVEYFIETEKNKITDRLSELISEEKKVVIVSANNKYIFPEKFTTDERLIIINYHYSYLPDYRGCNIPSWIIYNDEKLAGVSWHLVNGLIDGGPILARRSYELRGDETAFDIVKTDNQLASEAIAPIIRKLIYEEKIDYIENDLSKATHIYSSKDIPENGIFTKTDDYYNDCKLLRAYDYYSVEYIIPRLRFMVNGQWKKIKHYSLIETNKYDYILDYGCNKIYLCFDAECVEN